MKLTCDQEKNCQESVTMLDIKGYVYCTKHGIDRKSVCRCRRLNPKELRQLESGEPLKKY